ncbi:MAG: metal-binding protein [Gammaproteobacteria bacterium]|jgi:ribosome-binding protein aMBF1 (putative translation factor)|nr:metal-binding protein [Gammaproteobacteria bacterium]
MSESSGICDLCGLPVEGKPFELRTPGGVLQFCCDGCRGIYLLLNEVEVSPEEPDSGRETPSAPRG